MEKLFVPYEIALKLKEKKYEGYCLAVYLNDKKIYLDNLECAEVQILYNNKYTICQAPTYQQVIDWFRVKHKIHISINHTPRWVKKYDYYFGVGHHDFHKVGYNTYYGALNQAIKNALKII